jgi:hypothetical protein
MVLDTRNSVLINKVKFVFFKTKKSSALDAFSKLYSTFGKTKLSISSKFTAAGLLYNVKLECFHPGYDESKISEIHNLLKHQFIIKLQLTNDSFLQISSDDEPLEVVISADESNTKFTFAGNQTSALSPTSLKSAEIKEKEFPYKFPINF